MIDVVIINKSNNPAEIRCMLDSLNGANIHRIYYIADRCSEEFNNTLMSCKDSRLIYVMMDDGHEGRRTSTLRNIGYVLARDDKSKVNGVLFVDGDRFFTEGSSDDIDEDTVNNVPLDGIRDFDDTFLLLFRGQIINKFYSACVYLPFAVCDRLECHSYRGELWNEDIESVWGIEDLFMGNQLNLLGIEYIYNKKIRLNNGAMTGKDDMEEIRNVNRLMVEVVKYRDCIHIPTYKF